MTIALPLAFVACAVTAYGWFEAGWLRTRVIEVTVSRLPRELDGLRIGHLSDLHLGARFSRGNRASRLAVRWIAARRPDLVCVSGDLVSHPRGERLLRSLLLELTQAYVVLGNHDVALTRDPFSRAAELRDLERTVLLRDNTVTVMLRGQPVVLAGVDPESYQRGTGPLSVATAQDASFRLLLCHFPGIVKRIPAGSFDLILAGHLHAGQICLPIGRRRITLAHPRAHFVAGIYETDAGVMHVSPGSGTTFVPFRFFARPEVTELVLRYPS